MRSPGRAAKDLFKDAFELIGVEVSRPAKQKFGRNPYADIAYHLRSAKPLVFDIGANTGQSIARIRQRIPHAQIHSFEPSPTVYRELVSNTHGLDQVRLWNCAVGAVKGELLLNENSNTDLSSVLPLGPTGWGTVVSQVKVECRAIDEFVAAEGIDLIDVVKVDTQGFELEVFKGAESTLRNGKIGMILFEVNFEPLYEGLPTLPQLFELLTARGFRLVSIYDIHHNNGVAGWADALFINESYRQAMKPSPDTRSKMTNARTERDTTSCGAT